MAKNTDPATLSERRDLSKKTMMDIVEKAYDAKMISKTHAHGEIIYQIHVPHENLETYALVADHDV